MSELKNDLVYNREAWAETFDISEKELLEIMDASLQYQKSNQSYMDWCNMYFGIHRESEYEKIRRGWLACYRWMKSKELDAKNDLTTNQSPI